MRQRLIAICVLLSFASCDDSQQKRAERVRAEREAEKALFSDPIAAEREIQKRLQQRLSVVGNVFFIRPTDSSDAYVAPLSASWFVTCGASGLVLTFRQVGDGGEGVTVSLSSEILSQEQC